MNEGDWSREALAEPRRFYDERYNAGYMEDFTDLYEGCRVFTLTQVLNHLRSSGTNPASILDYGCGGGRYVPLMREIFPTASIRGGDVSGVAIEMAAGRNPSAEFS